MTLQALQACDVICEFNNLTLKKEKEKKKKKEKKESTDHNTCDAYLFEIVADNKRSGGAAVSATFQLSMISAISDFEIYRNIEDKRILIIDIEFREKNSEGQRNKRDMGIFPILSIGDIGFRNLSKY